MTTVLLWIGAGILLYLAIHQAIFIHYIGTHY